MPSQHRKRPASGLDSLTPTQAGRELKRLASSIAAHDRRYYQEDAPRISDAEYDALRDRNAAIDAWGEMSVLAADTQSGMERWFAACGFKINPLTTVCQSAEALLAFHRAIERSAERSTTTSTASSTRSIVSTGRSVLATCHAVRVGRSPTSSRRRRRPR